MTAPLCLRRTALLLSVSAAACGSADTVTDTRSPHPECTPLIEEATTTIPDPPDGAAACAEGVCNYQTQAGCEADEACRPQFNATDPEVAPGCEPAGAGQAGDDCEQQSDCAPGHYCAEGVCRRQCCGDDWSACDEGESCILSLQVRAGGEVLTAGMSLCLPVNTCDVFDPESCEDPTRECKPVDPTGAVACMPRSSAGLGDDCGPPDVCQQGLSCVGGVCIKLCSFVECGPVGCDEGDACVRFDRNPPGVGECTPGR